MWKENVWKMNKSSQMNSINNSAPIVVLYVRVCLHAMRPILLLYCHTVYSVCLIKCMCIRSINFYLSMYNRDTPYILSDISFTEEEVGNLLSRCQGMQGSVVWLSLRMLVRASFEQNSSPSVSIVKQSLSHGIMQSDRLSYFILDFSNNE